MSATQLGLLVVAGVGAGLTGSIAGLASLVSYPALLAVGLGPLAANVTNTLGLLTGGAGSAAGSVIELRGQGRRLFTLSCWCGVGGAAGAAVLLLGSSGTFEKIVPWLIALGSALLLARDRLRIWLARRRALRAKPVLGRAGAWRQLLPVVLVGVYGGYFGAGAGIIMLAVLSLATVEPLPVTNAVKNVTMTAANAVAAVIYAFAAPVNWPAAAALALGVLVGSWCGPAVVRVAPERPLQVVIAIGGFGLALALLIGWSGA